MTENKNDKLSMDLLKVMDIVRGMSYEEIQELLLSNPLYRFIVESDKEWEKKKNGIHNKSD